MLFKPEDAYRTGAPFAVPTFHYWFREAPTAPVTVEVTDAQKATRLHDHRAGWHRRRRGTGGWRRGRPWRRARRGAAVVTHHAAGGGRAAAAGAPAGAPGAAAPGARAGGGGAAMPAEEAAAPAGEAAAVAARQPARAVRPAPFRASIARRGPTCDSRVRTPCRRAVVMWGANAGPLHGTAGAAWHLHGEGHFGIVVGIADVPRDDRPAVPSGHRRRRRRAAAAGARSQRRRSRSLYDQTRRDSATRRSRRPSSPRQRAPDRPLAAAASTLTTKIEAVEGDMTQMRGEGGQDSLNFPGPARQPAPRPLQQHRRAGSPARHRRSPSGTRI